MISSSLFPMQLIKIKPITLTTFSNHLYGLMSLVIVKLVVLDLGLAITKKIVELHHGTISAAIDDGRITFTIKLPTVRFL